MSYYHPGSATTGCIVDCIVLLQFVLDCTAPYCPRGVYFNPGDFNVAVSWFESCESRLPFSHSFICKVYRIFCKTEGERNIQEFKRLTLKAQERLDAEELLEQVEYENRRLGGDKDDHRRSFNPTPKLESTPEQSKPRPDWTERCIQVRRRELPG